MQGLGTTTEAAHTAGVPAALILTRDNRLTGLLRELEAALREETSSVALWRAEQSLKSLRDVARSCALIAETDTRELERARHARPSMSRRRWRLP